MNASVKAILNNPEVLRKTCVKAFNKFDKDGSGDIQLIELSKVFEGFSRDLEIDPPSQEELESIYNTFDTDKNGVLNLEEFSEIIVSLLNKIVEE